MSAISSAPVLKFFDLEGVGAVILKNDRPVAYASKALSLSQQNYAEIEKEMLAIVFVCESFHDYLYGQREITVAGDHKPLEAIKKKTHPSSTLRLQKMILGIKPYAVKIEYLPGRHRVLTNTLSSAYLPIENAHQCDEFEIHLLDSGELSETMFQKLRDETKRDQDSSSCTQLS